MQLGPYQIQIFISLVVILGAAFVALICDLLKGNNEQLRELAVELKVRREEEHMRFQMLVPQTAAAHAGGGQIGASPRMEKVVAQVPREAPAPVEKKAPAARALSNPALAKPIEKRRAIAPEALAAMQRGAQLASPPRSRPQTERAAEPAPVKPTQVESPAPVETLAVETSRPAAEIHMERAIEVPVRPAPQAPARTNTSVRMTIAPPAGSGRDWGSLLTTRGKTEIVINGNEEKPGILDAIVAATTSTASAQAAEPVLPAGFQDGYVLTRLVESHQPVSGLVVSIGVSAPRNEDGSLPANVRSLIQSLIGPADFAAQSGEEEFLLIYPGERGAAAQRRLSKVAQQLWDFQLRSLGTYSILFSWGGVEVRSESIDEAIASATERMQETRRGRKVLAMDSRPSTETPLRRAV